MTWSYIEKAVTNKPIAAIIYKMYEEALYIYLLSLRKRMLREKSEPGRVAPVIPGRHGPVLRRKSDIHYLRLNSPP
jgi:hypothetical protein